MTNDWERIIFSKSASAGWHVILSYKNKILVINVTQYPWSISITVCNFSSTKICSLSIHVKYFADRNLPVDPSSTRLSVRDQWPVRHAADVKSDRWRPPRPHKCRVTAGENCLDRVIVIESSPERVLGNLFPSREIYFPGINNPNNQSQWHYRSSHIHVVIRPILQVCLFSYCNTMIPSSL